ncbi:PDR/VanB family oxidoreductase [Nocardia farcinica]|uniref:PDR/VanB family oxidoreductase n=1 Tax=Nocardia farcinica TaxID=37329 RepID=UPI00189419A8|nr:PDR/VanB family oxidoreductase [Nocardia farcinica]MBF6271644.1 oxidoreductase [Nocardia farcinica]MCZ9330370.1 PDR/VanB family oxidoreductase [Nocardia farcinica]
MPQPEYQRVHVEAMEHLTPEIVTVTLRSNGRKFLAPWSPGAHIDVLLPNWLVRQYSLCGDPGDRYRYRIAVRREALSRGGSEYIHDFLRLERELAVSFPRNTFTPPNPEAPALFIAGGIGITPMLPMFVHALNRCGRAALLYSGRSRSAMAFLDELARYGDHVTVVAEDIEGRPDFSQWANNAEKETQVYACGPEPMLAAVEIAFAAAGVAVQMERFRPRVRDFEANTEFAAVCARSGAVIRVGKQETLLDALLKSGVAISSGCREGVCGSCEITVLSGVPDHRDEIGAPDGRMYPCVSRSRKDRLVIDL